jgi:hypothetical protein
VSADNGRRAERALDDVPAEWWRFGWWVRSGPDNPPPAPTPPTAGPSDTSGRTKKDAADPVPAAAAGRLGIPATVLAAYRKAAARLQASDPGCRLSWEMLAGVGKVESGHAWGGLVTSRGDTVRPILGPRLDGSRYAAISDTDGGRLDGDTEWDRAVGPMQFIPSSWEHFASDGNADGMRNPHNVVDAALASGVYLCVGRGDLSRSDDLHEALYRYNHSTPYVQTVYAWILAYRQGGATATEPDLSQATRTMAGGDPSQGPPSGSTASPRPTGSPGPGGQGPDGQGPGDPGGPGPAEPDPEGPGQSEPDPGEEDPGEPDPGGPSTPTPGPTPGSSPSPWCPVKALPVCVELPPLDLDLVG